MMSFLSKNGALVLGLLAILLTGGCSSDEHTAASDPDLFRVDPTSAKLFLYVSYDNPDDKPWLSEKFRFRIDSGYIQDIDDGEFIVLKVTPGEEHVIEAEEVIWDGNIDSHVTLKEKFQAGAPAFVMVHVAPGQKPVLANADKEAGFTAVYKRLRSCLCTKSFWDYF